LWGFFKKRELLTFFSENIFVVHGQLDISLMMIMGITNPQAS
jgi:hypothetical protein